MAGELDQPTGGKLRRRATIFMTGAALTGLYVWMQPAALGTLEANSAQAADGSTSGCVLKVGSTPLTVGREEVRVQSNELCNGLKPDLVATSPAPIAAAEPLPDLLRSTIGEDTKRLALVRERFYRAVPRVKPQAADLVVERPEVSVAETPSDRDDDIERDHTRLAEREDRPDGPDEKPDDDRPDDRDDGGERDKGEVCERDDGGERYGGDGGEGRSR
jgi:hypothetical protein